VDVIGAGQGRGVSRGLIAGAASVYLLMAFTFSVWYRFALAVNPGAFAGAVDVESGLHVNSMLYFSFVTLTTVGYGDITPVGGGVRMLAIFEALAGQLYLTLLVARLVGIHISQATPRND
jgi:voltage-gated potassium channel Kch